MKLELFKVTWYSRLGTSIVFLVVMPILAFMIGKMYQETIDSLYKQPYTFIDLSKTKK